MNGAAALLDRITSNMKINITRIMGAIHHFLVFRRNTQSSPANERRVRADSLMN
jgi:hypothetical protein